MSAWWNGLAVVRFFLAKRKTFEGFHRGGGRRIIKAVFGRLAIIAGSSGYHGAAVLAARGAMRAGPGLITLSTMPECYLPVGAQLQQVMVERWREDWQMPAKTTGILVGPGLAGPDVSDRLIGQVREIWRETEQPVVIDASSLDWLPRGTATAGPRVITPHAGEAAQLLKSQPDDVNGNPGRLPARAVGAIWRLLGCAERPSQPGRPPSRPRLLQCNGKSGAGARWQRRCPGRLLGRLDCAAPMSKRLGNGLALRCLETRRSRRPIAKNPEQLDQRRTPGRHLSITLAMPTERRCSEKRPFFSIFAQFFLYETLLSIKLTECKEARSIWLR